MPNISDIRKKYPQYSDMSDDALASALYQKFYSDMPRSEFDSKLGLTPAPKATSAAPVDETPPDQPIQPMGEGLGAAIMGAGEGKPTELNVFGTPVNPKGKSVLERVPKSALGEPEVYGKGNMLAMYGSPSPESVMFDPGRRYERAERIVERQKKIAASDKEIEAKLAAYDAAKLEKQRQEQGWYGPVDLARDVAAAGAKGVVGLGQMGIGLATILTGWIPDNPLHIGQFGKMMSALGYDPERTKDFITGLGTPIYRSQEKEVDAAEGFLGTLKALAVNPAALTASIVESLPGTLTAGGSAGQLTRMLMMKATEEAAAKGLTGLAASKFISDRVKDQVPKIATAASASEGVMTTGSIAEQASREGREWSDYVAPALAAGFGTTAIGMMSGKVAKKFGIGDIETEIAARTAGIKNVGVGSGKDAFAKTVFKEMAKEGLLEELPQSFQEQIFTNLALGKPWDEGIGKAAAQGLMTGAFTAAGHATLTKALQRTGELIREQVDQAQLEAERGGLPMTAEELARSKGFLGGRKKSIDELISELDAEMERLDLEEREKAETQEGGRDDAGTVSPAGGAGVQVAGQPGGVSTAAGAGVPKPAGVDVAGQDVAGAEGRTSEQPGALTEAELEAAAEREAIQAESQQQAAPIDDSDIPDTDFQRKEQPPAAPSEAPTDVSRETPATTTPASTTAKTELQRLEQNLQDAERTLKEFQKKEGPDFFKDEDAYDAHQEEEERLKKAVEEASKALYKYKNSNAFAVTTGLQPAPASTTQKFKFSNREDFDNVVDEDTGELYPGYNYFAAFTEGTYVYPGSFVVINNAKDAETAKSNGMSFFSEKQKTVAELEAEIAKLKGQRDKLLTPTGKEPKTGTKKAADWDALTRQIEDRWAQISGLESGRTAEPATAPAALPAPITVASESRGKDNYGNATTDITLSNGSKYQIQRLNSTESMGLPGWHDANKFGPTEGGFLGNTKAEAVQELIRRETQRQQQAPLLTNEPFTLDVESRVVSDAVNNNLAPEDLRRLTAHYGLSPNSEKFIERVKADIVRFANEGAQAVAAAIRDIIQKLHAGVLSVALIFNPTNITSPEFAFYPSYTRSTTTEVLAEVPAAAAEKMSPEAKRAYQVLYPSIKDQLLKNNKFMVIADKRSARIFVFRPDGSLLLEKKSLFGLTKGDMYKGNTDLPQNRITPAGLFTMGLRDATRSASEARTAGEYDFKKVFVLDKAIDGEYSVTLFHSVWLHESDAAARARALQSESAEDSRYSFGCINVDKSTYKYLIDNHLQQMDGASLFIVPDDPANLASMLSGKPKAGDELTRTEFTPATETKTETVPLQQAETKPSSTVMDADRRRNVLNSITANATKSTASVAPNIADLVRANMTGIRRLIAEYRAGRLTAEQFADQMLRLQERITTEGDIRRNAALNRVRGADRVMEALLQAKRQGRISAETADFALWFLSQNPAMATNLGISISIPKNRTAQQNLENTAGFYSPFAQLVRIVTQRDPETGQYSETNPDTAVHEILHHIERMLPDNIRKMIRNEWSKQVKAELKKATARNDTNAIRYLELVLYANAAKDETAAFAAGKMVKDGDVPEFMYALFDPSEFWAVRGSDLLAGRYGAHTRFARAKQFIKEFIQTVKGVFGLQSDSPILKGLESALRGDGTFVSRRMLNEGSIFTNVQQIAPKGLHSDVADAINRNDITGAMKAMARNTSGFYSALADRLAALNLPTSIGFNNQRALVRKIIDDRSAQQQLRLFAYLSREAPTFYDQYFKDYDKVENLERVAEGLSLIETTREGFTARNINTAPVATELAAVREAYRRNMPGLTAPGFFAPTLDAVNIRPDRTLGTNNRVVLHEVVHAATEYMLYGEVRNLTQEQQAAVADLNEMYKFAQTKLSPDEYGFTNLSEFVAEVMTNKDFQNKLKAIPYPPRKTTLLGAFKQLIGRMFGFNNLAGAAMSAIDDIISPQRPTSGVRAGPLKFATSGKKKRVRGPVSKPDTFRTAESVDRTIMDVVSDASQGKQSIGSAISDLKGALWSASGGAVRTVMLPVLQLRQLKDLTRSKFPQFAGAVRIVEQMVAYRGKKIRTAEEIVKRWGQLQSKSPQQSDLMSRIMIEATIRGRDPDAGVAPGALPDALDNAWDGLDIEFKEIYRDVRQFYADSVEEMVRTMKQRALGRPKAQRQAMIRKINEQFGPKKLAYPYFPLRRFGTHWLQVGKGPYKEFYTFDNPVSRQLAFYQRRRELESGNAQQRKLAETMHMGNGISELFSQNMSATQAIKELEETLDNLTATDVAGVKEEIRDSMHQLVYLLLPQQSMRKMFINRKAIQGMSSDMLRVFAHSSVHSAYQQARFKYAEPFTNNISNARSYIRDMEESKAITPEQGSVYRDYVLELEKRVSNVLGVEDKSMAAKVGNTIASTVFYWMLTAPASALINIVGASQITMPYIGGRYGYAKTNATMLKYLGLYIASTPTRSLAPMVKGQFSQVSFPSIVESGFVSKMDPMIQRAAQRLIADGDINISMTNDIFDLSEMPSALYTGKINTVKKVLSGVFHQAERLNREVSMLTAFELAFERYNGADKRDIRGVVERDSAGNPIKYTPDEAFEKALEDARDIGGLTLGDFSRQMKGRVFQHPGINLITQFKQYAVTATYAVLRNFYLTVGAPFKTAEIEQFRKQMIADKVAPAVIEQRIEEAEKFRKEVYREGMKRLAGILGMTFLYGGIAAQPFFNMLGQLIAMFAPDGDDKDEYFDWQNWFYNYMQSEVGGAAAAIFEKMGMKAGKAKDAGEELGMALARGPVAALTGTSLAERVSLDLKNLWWKDLPYSNELKQDFEKAALELLGPFVGLGTNWAQAWDLATKGQYQRAFEKALPAIASKPVTAARLGTEGATDMKGATIMGLYADQFSSWELAMQALGFQPEKLARAMKAASQVKAKEAKIHNERAAILDRLYLERGTDEYADVYEKARDFSIRYPQLKIDDTVISDAFEERDRARVEAEAKGVRIDKKLYPELGPMTNYGWGNR